MVCELAQNEAFQKILLKKIEKLKKQLEKAENDLDEQMLKNEALEKEKEDLKEEYWEKGWENGKEDCYAEYDEGVALKEDYVSMKKHRDTLLEESEETFMKVHNLEEENKELKDKLVEKQKSYLTKCEINLLQTKKIDELKEEAKKIEKAVRDVGHYETIDACLPIWYGQDQEEEEEEADYKLHLKGEERVLPNGVVLIT